MYQYFMCKGEVLPITCHEGTGREEGYRSTFFLTLGVGGGGGVINTTP